MSQQMWFPECLPECFVAATCTLMMHFFTSKIFGGSDETEPLYPPLLKNHDRCQEAQHVCRRKWTKVLFFERCRETNDRFARGCVMAKHARGVSASVNDPGVPGRSELTHFGFRGWNQSKVAVVTQAKCLLSKYNWLIPPKYLYDHWIKRWNKLSCLHVMYRLELESATPFQWLGYSSSYENKRLLSEEQN